MRNMSFALTTQQLIDGSKDVTRRLGWLNVKVGESLCAVEKCQGLKKGEKINRLKVIRVKSVSREPLINMTKEECKREGFPKLEPAEFISLFCKANKCDPSVIVTRIEFEHMEIKS